MTENIEKRELITVYILTNALYNNSNTENIAIDT